MEKIYELRAQGKSLRAISTELGVTYYSVRKHLSQSRQPAAEGSDLAQPGVQEQLDELRVLVLEIQDQLKPILKERAKAKQRRDEERYEEPTTGFRFGKK